jgi:hypothetical protein
VIQVSEIAAIALLESLQASGVEPDKGLRLKKEDSNFILKVDSSSSNDRVIWHDKCTVLIVDQDTEEEIGDALVDVDEQPEEARLVLRRYAQE